MSIELIFHCDGPGCERHVQTCKPLPPVFLTVLEDGQPSHFCGWDCVLRHAAAKEPETVISGSPDDR